MTKIFEKIVINLPKNPINGFNLESFTEKTALAHIPEGRQLVN